MPYAYGAIIEHEFDTDHLNVWLTFRHPMEQSVKPSNSIWTLKCDSVSKSVSSSSWEDEFTLLLVSSAVTSNPARVTLEYIGPDENLKTTWGKQWEPFGETLSENVGSPLCFVDRGDPSTDDFQMSDFTLDGNWNDLDLSGIIPPNVKAVLVTVTLMNSSKNKVFGLRTNGNSNAFNVSKFNTQVASTIICADMTVAPDANGVIEYIATVGGWMVILLTVRGWWY